MDKALSHILLKPQDLSVKDASFLMFPTRGNSFNELSHILPLLRDKHRPTEMPHQVQVKAILGNVNACSPKKIT